MSGVLIFGVAPRELHVYLPSHSHLQRVLLLIVCFGLGTTGEAKYYRTFNETDRTQKCTPCPPGAECAASGIQLRTILPRRGWYLKLSRFSPSLLAFLFVRVFLLALGRVRGRGVACG